MHSCVEPWAPLCTRGRNAGSEHENYRTDIRGITDMDNKDSSPLTIQYPFLDLNQIRESGQCFRMSRPKPGLYRIIAGSSILYARQTGFCGPVTLYCPNEQFHTFWEPYLDLDTDYEAIQRLIPAEDKYLTAAAEKGAGIRILRQDPFETLITFIISQRKNIPAIRTCVEKLCALCGEEILSSDSPSLQAAGIPTGGTFYAFPTPQSLAAVGEDALYSCSLGYRAPYISKTARRIAQNPKTFAQLQMLPDDDLLAALKEFPGVGEKVARCTMLFGFHRLAAFPVDVWIRRVICEHYNGRIDLQPFGAFAGVMQQYMFYAAIHS